MAEFLHSIHGEARKPEKIEFLPAIF